MSPSDITIPDLATRPGDDDREAPSGVINACQSMVRTHFLLGVLHLIFTWSVPWLLYQMSEKVRLVSRANGQPPARLGDYMLIAGIGFGSLALILALLFFRSAGALRVAGETRRLTALHRALRRVRTVWRVFAVTLLLAAVAIAAYAVMNAMPARPAG
jgi:hypothetical protein